MMRVTLAFVGKQPLIACKTAISFVLRLRQLYFTEQLVIS
jgi:hypothetical protein